MPELPEVETTRRGISPHITGQRITRLIVRQPRLRWPIPAGLPEQLAGRLLDRVERRAKYLLLQLTGGTLLIHLGMSGSLRIVSRDTAPGPHDHFDLVFGGLSLRYRDPRRFGSLLWTTEPVTHHPLLSRLGPEPLEERFDTAHLWRLAANRRGPVKGLLMDSRVVAGVGNIYANEALFMSGIHPRRPCNRISRVRYERVVGNVKHVLQEAIRQGGTTLRDFRQQDGKPGYFAQQLLVYGREGAPCPACGNPIRRRVIVQRSSFFCIRCQR